MNVIPRTVKNSQLASAAAGQAAQEKAGLPPIWDSSKLQTPQRVPPPMGTIGQGDPHFSHSGGLSYPDPLQGGTQKPFSGTPTWNPDTGSYVDYGQTPLAPNTSGIFAGMDPSPPTVTAVTVAVLLTARRTSPTRMRQSKLS